MSLASQLPPLPEFDARLVWEVEGGDGNTTTHVVVHQGKPADLGFGKIEDPDLIFRVSYEDVVAMHKGELEPSVAFMQGRLKADGDQALWLQLLAITATPIFQQSRKSIAEHSEFQ